MNKKKEKKFERVINWGRWDGSFEFYKISFLALLGLILISPILPFIVWIKYFKNNLKEREIYWREIK